MNGYAGVLLLLLIGVTAGCGEDAGVRASIRDVKARYSEQLLARPGVVSVGVGLDDDGNPAVIVGTDGSNPEAARELPQSLEGYPVVTRTIGPVKAQ